ncbi:methionine biosynthesis PLP-dependent protein [Gracilibacillus oryzae]|uniref:Methionine biosynthesis PLP-dependent protein n=1 Tax=Gracilibacillus oryzae TaxID=1672701 RepID=A0A7C8GX64_9BACI|nr:methionine biosynthesis PLP-dependent protein [Gracilibacillus oryzae]KAB8139410.1 methionine biosynthesis PLP-dependent protein [Gracilibacillus oryzae]
MKHIDTILAKIGNGSDPATGAVEAPIYLSTAYQHKSVGQSTGYDYTRSKNPTRDIVEETIAKLENGTRGFACTSGMAAIQLIFSLFEKDDQIIVTEDVYGGSYRLFDHYQKAYNIEPVYVTPDKIEENITSRTKALFIETPTNPLLIELDIKEIAAIAKKHDLLFIVDNTFYTPYLQKPLDDGADIVIHSATKYLAGHNDVLAGLVVAKGEELSERLYYLHNAIGAVLSPFDCTLLIRGMKTLGLRLEKQQQNAQDLAAFLADHELIADVLYPGRGGMMSFRVKDKEMVPGFLSSLETIIFAESLGGVESFITYPTTQTHADIPEAERDRRGVCKRLLRFSVGIEHIEDLKNDINQALVKSKEEIVHV